MLIDQSLIHNASNNLNRNILSNFIEIRFPEDIACGSVGGPEYSTDIVTTAGGYEQRNINWSQSRMRFNVAQGIKTAEQFQEILSFFRNCRGRALGFRFKDWSDYLARNELIGIGDGRLNKFQLTKTYIIQLIDKQIVYNRRIITKPVSKTVSIYLNEDKVEINQGINIDYTSGELFFQDPPLNNSRITADFEFDVPVRFDTDYLPSSIEGYGVHSYKEIPIVEIR